MRFSLLGKSMALLTLMLFPAFIWAQITVSGTVSDAEGVALQGATVLVQGTTTGTLTNEKGEFSLSAASESSVLVVSYIGFITQEITIGSQRELSITMSVAANTLEDVVIVGYGAQQKRDLTSAISNVKGDDFENLPVLGASQALQGRVAGIDVVRTGGAPGQSASLRIRGTGTINDANPLIVIDGVPTATGSIDDVNPNDIESIEVLKDATAAAIYGLRAANGVVIITTKRGNYNDKISFSLNAYAGVSNNNNTIDVLDASTLAEVKREAYTNAGRDIPAIWNEQVWQVQRTDWQDELLGTGNVQNYDFSIRGGSQKSSFSMSGGYFRENGMMENTFYERYSIRINSDHKPTEWFKFGESLQLTRRKENFAGTNSAQSGVLWSAIRFHPSLPVIAEQELPGHDIGDYGSSQISGEFGDINNPIFTTVEDEADDISVRNRILGNVYAEVSIIPNMLSVRANFGLDGQIFDRRRFGIQINDQIRARARNELDRNYNEFYSLLAEYYLNFNKTFGIHDVKFVGGYSAQYFNSEGFEARGRDFADEDPSQRFLNNASNLRAIGGNREENSLASVFGRLNYSLMGRYLITAIVRADGSSRFAEGNKWGTFPSISGAWRISEEPFFNVPFINDLKVYGGYGELGNQSVAALQYLALINRGRRYSFGGQPITGASLSRIPNENIQWEITQTTNVGLEFGLFDSKLIGNINYFIRDTEDMLLAPPSLGTLGTASIPDQNVGEIRNSGLELEATYRTYFGDVRFSVSGNVSFIQNEVRRINLQGTEGPDVFLTSRTYGRPNEEITRTFVGEPIGTFFGWQTDGIYQSQAEIESDPNIANDPRRANGQIAAGDVRFVDTNGDGVVDDQDRVILGDPFPDATYGANFELEYKGIDLNLFFLGVAGLDLYNADRMQGLDASYPFNMYAEVRDRWTPNNPSNTIPRASVNRDNRNFRTSDLFIEDGSFLRLKNLVLGYTLPSEITSLVGLGKVRFYVQGQNVFTVTDYSGIDPELGYTDGNEQRGVDYAQYPQAQTWTFGATVNF